MYGEGVSRESEIVDLGVDIGTLEKSGAKVIMTRKDDTFVTLQDRVSISNFENADLFVQIFDAYTKKYERMVTCRRRTAPIRR